MKIATERNGRKTLTTVQGIPAKFDHKKILKVIKKEFGMSARLGDGQPDANRHAACNGTIISDTESKGMGEVIQLQGDHRIKIKDFLVDAETGLSIDEKNIKVRLVNRCPRWPVDHSLIVFTDPRLLSRACPSCRSSAAWAPKRGVRGGVRFTHRGRTYQWISEQEDPSEGSRGTHT